MKNLIKALFFITFIFILLVPSPIFTLSVFAQPEATMIHVATSGTDCSSCGSPSNPCRSIQYAVDKALSGDTIKVAKGTYTYTGANLPSTCYTSTITPSVVCIIDKHLTLLGGYSTSNWSLSAPDTNQTIIDGQNDNRGLSILGTSENNTLASLQMEGFTIQNGLAQGANSGQDYQIGGYGGGMFTNAAAFTLHDMIFQNNRAIGGNTNKSYGGHATGGGLAVNGIPQDGTGLIENVHFTNNYALGGTGNERGGATFGGGLYTYSATIVIRDVTITGNIAQAGSSSGDGFDPIGEKGDALGGGVCIHSESIATLENVSLINNRAIGGIATGGQAGAGHGGGIFSELAAWLQINDTIFEGNQAIGGYGKKGGIGGGGGMTTNNTWLAIERSKFIANTAKGGEGTELQGSAGGGGAYLTRFSGNTNISISNSVFADNYIERGAGPGDIGGGGGGLWLQGVQLDIIHTTIDNNRMDPGLPYGSGMLLYYWAGSLPFPKTNVNLSYGAITNHEDTFNNPYITPAAVHVWNGSTITFQRGLFAGNANDTNDQNDPSHTDGPGTINNQSSMISTSSAGYISPGSPNYNYHLRADAEAKDKAYSCNITNDIDGEHRPYDTQPDIGADEYQPFALTVVPKNTALHLNWERGDVILKGGVDHYNIHVACAQGANQPNEGQCDVPIFAGQSTSFDLTGLSNYSLYTISVFAEGYDQQAMGTSTEIVTAPTDLFLYIPLTLK